MFNPENPNRPALVDGCQVGPWADILQDVGVLLTADVERGVVGFTHSEEVRCWVAHHQLKDVSDKGSGTKTERMNTWGHRKMKQMVHRQTPLILLLNVLYNSHIHTKAMHIHMSKGIHPRTSFHAYCLFLRHTCIHKATHFIYYGLSGLSTLCFILLE